MGIYWFCLCFVPSNYLSLRQTNPLTIWSGIRIWLSGSLHYRCRHFGMDHDISGTIISKVYWKNPLRHFSDHPICNYSHRTLLSLGLLPGSHWRSSLLRNSSNPAIYHHGTFGRLSPSKRDAGIGNSIQAKRGEYFQ